MKEISHQLGSVEIGNYNANAVHYQLLGWLIINCEAGSTSTARLVHCQLRG